MKPKAQVVVQYMAQEINRSESQGLGMGPAVSGSSAWDDADTRVWPADGWPFGSLGIRVCWVEHTTGINVSQKVLR